MRRGTLIYIGCIIALLAVGLWLQLTQPRPVDWTATYDHKDTGPFGCAVFDSVMAFTLPAGYRPVAETWTTSWRTTRWAVRTSSSSADTAG